MAQAKRRQGRPPRESALSREAVYTRCEAILYSACDALQKAVRAFVVDDECALQRFGDEARQRVSAARRLAIDVQDAEVLRALNRVVRLLEELT